MAFFALFFKYLALTKTSLEFIFKPFLRSVLSTPKLNLRSGLCHFLGLASSGLCHFWGWQVLASPMAPHHPFLPTSLPRFSPPQLLVWCKWVLCDQWILTHCLNILTLPFFPFLAILQFSSSNPTVLLQSQSSSSPPPVLF